VKNFYDGGGMNYNAGKFSDLAELQLGKDLWAFLNEKENIIRMELATEFGKTAAESVSKPLLEKFGNDVKVNRVKQMIGHMIRQIMEERGYEMGSQNVVVSIKRLFTKASKYKDGTTKTTKIGYINKNNQQNLGTAGVDGTDHGQKAYKMKCLNHNCGYEYGANGTDIWLRNCPRCQKGQPGIPFE